MSFVTFLADMPNFPFSFSRTYMSVARLKAVLYSLFFFAAAIQRNCAAVEVERGIVVAGVLSFVDIVVIEEMGSLGMLTVNGQCRRCCEDVIPHLVCLVQ